jgi:peptidyl-tRNA hydrolase, PTH1 family
MKLIVGLGNPGKIYENTRHNIGSAVVKELGKARAASLKRGLFGSSLSARVSISGQECILSIPLSYMNLSGGPVRSLLRKHRIELRDLIVVHDDLDLEPGKIKLKTGGSSAGHKGLDSIIASLGGDGFCRLRVGIGRPEHKEADISGYVLSAFRKGEKETVAQTIDRSCEALELWVKAGAEQTMNIINR